MANTLRFKRGLASGIPTALAGEPLFTTDTFDLYIGNGTTNTRFQKYIASGTTSQLLRGDGSLLTMPIVLTSPSNGQVLKYDGTNWVNSADAGVTGSGTAGQVTYWGSSSTITGSNNLFWDATNNRLGIGVSSPLAPLQIGNGYTDAGYTGFRNTNSPAFLIASASTDTFHRILGGTYNTASTINVDLALPLTKNLATAGTGFRITSGVGTGITTVNGYLAFSSLTGELAGTFTATERMRLVASTGNLLIGSTTDNGLRFQVTGDGYFSGSVGIGSTALTTSSLRISRNIAGGGTSYGIFQDGVIQSSVSAAEYFYTSASTQATTFTLNALRHYLATQGTFGAGSTVNNQYGFFVAPSLTGAVNNYAFYGDIALGTGRWNIFMNGTASNYLRGQTSIGGTSVPDPAGAWPRALVIGNNGADKIILGYLGSSTNGATIGANNSSLDSWARLNVAGSDILFRIAETERMRLTATNGNLHIGTFSSDSGEKLQVTGTMKVTGNTQIGTLLSIGTTSTNYTLSVSQNNLPTLGFIDPTEATDQKQWAFQSGVTVGAGVFRLRALNDAFTNGQNAFIITKSGFAIQTHQWFTANTERMRITSLGDIGIGTTAPTSITGYTTLAVGNATNGGNIDLMTGATRVASWNNTATETYFGTRTSTPLVFTTNATERMRLDASGNLGLGVVPSAWSSQFRAMHFLGNGASISGRTDVAAINVNSNWYWDGSNSRYIVNGFASTYRQYLGAHEWSTAPSGTAGNAITFTQAMTLDASGNLGIGTTSPSVRTQIDSTGFSLRLRETSDGSGLFLSGNQIQARTSAGTGTDLYLNYTSGGSIWMPGSGTNLIIGSLTSSGERLQVTGTARISGEFRVAAAINSTQATFANTTGRGLAISTAVVGGTNEAAVVLNARSSVTSGTFIFQTDGTQRVQIDSTGLIINGGNALEFINSAANAVSAIRPTSGGTSVMSTNSNGLHIAVGTEAAGDLILASNNTERVRLSSNGWFSHTSATNPSSSVTDSYVQYSADVTAGNAAPHFRTENGAVIKIYQETTSVGNSIFSQGGGNSVLDDSTFDGYTLRQIVKALRNQGILA